jgi:hypothetical protein
MFPRQSSSASRPERRACPATVRCRWPGRMGYLPNGRPRECSRCTGPLRTTCEIYWRIHDSLGLANGAPLGCVCRIRGRLSGTRRVAAVAALRNSTQARKAAAAATRLSPGRNLNVGRSESFHWGRLLIPISDHPSQIMVPAHAYGRAISRQTASGSMPLPRLARSSRARPLMLPFGSGDIPKRKSN